jgi:hypothetical protein
MILENKVLLKQQYNHGAGFIMERKGNTTDIMTAARAHPSDARSLVELHDGSMVVGVVKQQQNGPGCLDGSQAGGRAGMERQTATRWHKMASGGSNR